MKLVNCLQCGDIVRLELDERTCKCGRSKGKYLSDGLHAEYSGPARILGMLNWEWHHSKLNPPKAPFQQDYTWFVIGHWPGCHISKTDDPTLHNEVPYLGTVLL